MPRRIEQPAELDLTLTEVSVFTNKEVWKTQQQWRETYARRFHEETGKWTHRGFDWHIFSYGLRDHVEGRKALAALEQELPATVLVFSDVGDTHCYGFRGEMAVFGVEAPRHDIIVAAPDFKWTFVSTHEMGLGPYFSRSGQR